MFHPFPDQALLLILVAFVADLVLGDPRQPLHPVRLLGLLCARLERALRALGLSGHLGGILHWVAMLAVALGVWWGIRALLLTWSPWAGFAWDALVAWQLLCLRDLLVHGLRVRRALSDLARIPHEELERARAAVGRLVGRDTRPMDRAMIVRAAVESLAENLTDGVLTPLWALCLGGLPALIAVKVISTLDSMIGYRDEPYRRFGWAAARADDLIHLLPARLGVLLIALAACPLGLHPWGALRGARRWHGLLASPNSGWTEAAYAGALRLRLLGPIFRDGEQVCDVWMGEAAWGDAAGTRDLTRALLLTALCGALALAAGIGGHLLLYG